LDRKVTGGSLNFQTSGTLLLTEVCGRDCDFGNTFYSRHDRNTPAQLYSRTRAWFFSAVLFSGAQYLTIQCSSIGIGKCGGHLHCRSSFDDRTPVFAKFLQAWSEFCGGRYRALSMVSKSTGWCLTVCRGLKGW